MKIGPYSYYSAPRTDSSERIEASAVVQRGETEGATPDPVAQRFQELQEGLQRLQAMPREVDMNKAGFLKQRLEMLKSLMMFASSKQLASIAKELKSIASEFNRIAKGLGGSGMTTALPAPALNAAPKTQEIGTALASAQSAKSVAASLMSGSATTASTGLPDGTTPAPVGSGKAGEEKPPSGVAYSHVPEQAATTAEADDKALLDLLRDARKSLKEAIALLKSALDEENRDGKKALRQAEKQLAKLDRTLAMSTSDAPYSVAGLQLFAPQIGAAQGINIDISV
ncbi:hypothetical protein [Salinicola peritrichatus]|uniref:hypothetical protein n=1 Tax=Salinicola peritrichatus TaxID=1267424 RepID=UPI000DA258CA|nr:hypothetical protein [Salinicola peritrichatus]